MTHAMLTKIIINLVIFIAIGIGSFVYLKKIKLDGIGYKFIFITYTMFWISPMLLRAYSGTLQKAIDPNFAAIVLASYGIVGIFMRIFADILNFSFKSRKSFLFLSCIIQLATYIPVVIIPNTTTSLLQSIGVGVGASCIGSFQLMFKEQYNENKSYATVSLLSIPPLLANFLTAPLQSIVMVISKDNQLVSVGNLKYLWLIGTIFTFATFILIFFIKEDRNKFGITNIKSFNNKTDMTGLVWLSIIGTLIAFIKFSNSGSVATSHLQTLADNTGIDVTAFEGYLSVVFSLLQLVGGILVGTYLIKKLNYLWIFSIGIFIWIIYMLSTSFINNPIGYFVMHSLNGFSYGILYNFVLGAVLSKSFSKKWITPMGIYQSILSIGIALSGIFTQMIKINLEINFALSIKIINFSLIGASILSLIFYAIYWYSNIYINRLNKFKSFSIRRI